MPCFIRSMMTASSSGSCSFLDFVMSSSTKWPAYPIGPAPHVHAVGAATLNYANLETILDLLLFHLMGVEYEVQAFVFSKLNHHSRIELLRTCIPQRIEDPEALDHLDYFIKCYGLCAEIRNTLAHAQTIDSELSEEVLAMAKRSRDKPHVVNEFKLSLPAIRRAADEISAVYFYGIEVYFRIKGILPPLLPGPNRQLSFLPPVAWPSKPPQPAPLIQQIPSTRKKRKRPPRSSRT